MLTLIALSAALLQDPPAPPPPPEVRSQFVFVGGEGPGRLDADGDGQVTREEFSAPMAGAFTRMDKDGDGRLSGDEMASGHGDHHAGPGGEGEIFVMRGDGGGEGRRIEFRRPGRDGGARIERDGDRVIVFSSGGAGLGGEREFRIRTEGGGEPHVIRLEGHDGPGSLRIHGFGGPEGRRGGADLDKDGDGKISEAEFTAPLREAFARMDADRSGFVEDGERGEGHDVRVFTHRIDRDGDD